MADRRTVAAYSRRSLDLLRHAGLGWLRHVRWPVSQAVLDGEVCGDTGSDGIQSLMEARRAPRWYHVLWPSTSWRSTATT